MQLVSGHLKGLLSFSGREGRKPFWIWAALNLVLSMAMMAAVMVPTMIDMFSRIERFADEHPEQVTRTYGPGSYSIRIEGDHPELMPDFSGMIGWIGLGTMLSVILLAAAVVRRLHDSGRSGVWGLLPLPFLTAGMVMMPRLFDQFAAGPEPDLGIFFAVFLNNLAYLAALGVLIVLLALRGTPGENRFGPPPAN